MEYDIYWGQENETPVVNGVHCYVALQSPDYKTTQDTGYKV